jgi:23S rRNA (adenine2503-C2)-methyltransferase
MQTADPSILLGKYPDELREIALRLDLPGYVGDQVAKWLYQSDIISFDEMKNISLKNRKKLGELYTLGLAAPEKVQVSGDGTRKYLFPVHDHKYVESAYMPEKSRNTLCVSTQIGCKMGCLFCMTGKQGFQGNLGTGEILNQLRSLPEKDTITNIVFMGMGEPFDNTGEVMKSLHILTADWGFGFSPKRITVSTIGLIPGLKTYLEYSDCNLAISLHSPFDEERKQLMPVQIIYPVKEVIATLESYSLSRYRKISFEYILFKDINDTPRHIKELARLLNKLKCRVNLMPFHAVPAGTLSGSGEEAIRAFQRGLNEKGITATIRHSRGLDIDAACGLLSTKVLLSNQRSGI